MNEEVIATINSDVDPTYIDLGAGGKSPRPGYLAFDILPAPGVDVCGDLNEVLPSIRDAVVAGVFSRHFMEHVEDTSGMLRQISRICKDGALVEVIVPHFSNPYYYSDVTHRRFWGLYSFCYLAESLVPFRRTVPSYARIEGLTLERVQLNFFSHPGGTIRAVVKRIAHRFFNRSSYLQEMYEQLFCWLIPCYELHYYVRVRKQP